jgi:hypothetical protein
MSAADYQAHHDLGSIPRKCQARVAAISDDVAYNRRCTIGLR